MEQKLLGKKIAVIATDGFEKSEPMEPKRALEQAGAKVEVISLKRGKIRSWSHDQWDASGIVHKTIDEVTPGHYDALLLPGGVMNADTLRRDRKVVEFAKEFMRSNKPIAAICHAAWLLIETGCLQGRKLTSWPSLKTDLENAGALWFDAEVINDHGLVTSRMPGDLPAFNRKMVEEFAAGPRRAAPNERYT